VGGVVIYVLGQITTRFLIDPYQEYRKTVGEIAYALVFYANVYQSPGRTRAEMMDEASRLLRRLASSLRVHAFSIPCRGVFWRLPSSEDLRTASSALISLSNGIHQGNSRDNQRDVDEINKLLGLPPIR